MKTMMICAVLALGVAAGVCLGREFRLQGGEAYAPTKLEWLALEIEASHRFSGLQPHGFNVGFWASPNDDAIVIAVQQLPNADRQSINIMVKTYRQVIQNYAQKHGWDWVSIREEYKEIKP